MRGWPIPPSFGEVGLFVTTPQSQGHPQQQWKTWWPGIGESCWEVYRRRFVATRLAATLLADGAPCFAICACPALVIKRVCSYISIHFSLEIAEISLPIAASGKSSGDLGNTLPCRASSPPDG